MPHGPRSSPLGRPEWDPSDLWVTWWCRRFQVCLLAGLWRSRVKPLNYSKISSIIQGAEENPSAFLGRLRGALAKHTYLSPDSAEGNLILKDKFITQPASDIRRKLQKLALGPESTLDHLLKVATVVFYNQDQEEAKERNWGERRQPCRWLQPEPTPGRLLYGSIGPMLQLWVCRTLQEGVSQ